MVRINLINPKALADQHLIAEYVEILMLIGYVKKYPDINNSLNSIPKEYVLGKGHMIFFKNKLNYLKKRHELIKKEMKQRGFRIDKSINLKEFSKTLLHDFKPTQKDLELIKRRLIWKISLKPEWYKYYGKQKTKGFFIELIKKSN